MSIKNPGARHSTEEAYVAYAKPARVQMMALEFFSEKFPMLPCQLTARTVQESLKVERTHPVLLQNRPKIFCLSGLTLKG